MRPKYVERARDLVGSRFRAQGRNPSLGLDCVGLALEVYDVPDAFRRNYRLRGDHLGELKAAIARYFRQVSRPQRRAGDLLIWSVATDQVHLGIETGRSFIHAEARLARVVESPNPAPWRLLAVFRRRLRPVRKG